MEAPDGEDGAGGEVVVSGAGGGVGAVVVVVGAGAGGVYVQLGSTSGILTRTASAMSARVATADSPTEIAMIAGALSLWPSMMWHRPTEGLVPSSWAGEQALQGAQVEGSPATAGDLVLCQHFQDRPERESVRAK